MQLTGCCLNLTQGSQIFLKHEAAIRKRAESTSVEKGYAQLNDRITLQGKLKVSMQRMLHCTVHSIEKIVH